MLIEATRFISKVPALHPLSISTQNESHEYIVQHQRFQSGFGVSCAFEFTLMCFSELLVLHRYLDLAFKGINPTTEQLLLTRRYFVAACFAVAFGVSDIICAIGSAYYRVQSSQDLNAWASANLRADYFTAGQMLSEMFALAIKVVLFICISRMDLARLAKIERWTLDGLVPVRMSLVLFFVTVA